MSGPALYIRTILRSGKNQILRLLSLLWKVTLFFSHSILDFFYPPHCSVCRVILGRNESVVCESCWDRVKVIDSACSRCGCPLGGKNELCKNCSGKNFKFSRARVLASYDQIVQNLIHLFKYRQKVSVGRRLAKMLAESVAQDSTFSGTNLIVPVPLHKSRMRERGYNQSAVIAKELSRTLGVPTRNDVLIRRHRTEEQAKLPAEEREKNVADAFAVRKPDQVSHKRILIVDDVLTTGSTLNACAQKLLEAGATEVFVATLASPFEV